MIDFKKELQKKAKNSIRLHIGGEFEGEVGIGRSKFGGSPDVPEGFVWERFKGENFDGEIKDRPLTFFAQFDLAEISKYDTEGLLPKTGVLSFFYDYASQPWGYDPKDKGCARVYWFPDKAALHRAEFPADIWEHSRLPEFGITAECEKSYPDYEELLVQRDPRTAPYEDFETAAEKLGIEEPDERTKLLGFADTIQGSMPRECELVYRGYYLGSGWDDVKPQDRQEAEQWGSRDWQLLFQLDSVIDRDDFELTFGDGGRIYFYIRREDLAAKSFDNVWLILQCC